MLDVGQNRLKETDQVVGSALEAHLLLGWPLIKIEIKGEQMAIVSVLKIPSVHVDF